MVDLSTIQTFLKFSDWANERVVRAAFELIDRQLDEVFEMGSGSLRRTLLHILAGEFVWLERWQGRRDTPWPNEKEPAAPSQIWDRFQETSARRDSFLRGINREHLTQTLVYRDSKGGLFSASLGDMMLQMCLHSTHHRAQAVNMLRRLGADSPELDYMMHVRQPAVAVNQS